MRMPVTKGRAQSRPYTIQPAVRGWIVNEPLANSKPGGARVLENMFPTLTSVRVRGGAQKYATISTGPVLRLFSYKSGSNEKFFASDETNIFDVSSIIDADTIPTADVSGQTSGYYATAQFGTAGGDFISVVNGADTPLYFDGTTWADHAFTGLATPEDLSFVWTYASRLWYVQKDTMKAWYLPVDSINGALTSFSLAGVFQDGGVLLFGGKWSLDSGDGLDDKCFFMSSTGEVAVYQGTDPSSASGFSKVGVYKITPPMGMNAWMMAGGEPLIATEDGIVPLSMAVNKDAAALSLSAVTKNIEPEWKTEVSARKTMPWEILKWPTNNMMVVSLPVVSTSVEPYCFVANLETGAWAKFTNWNTRCVGLYDDHGYFGSNDGCVYRMETGGSDDGEPYTCTYVGLPDHLRSPGATKIIHSIRSVFIASVPFTSKVSASVNYNVTLPTAPSSVADYTTDEWDSAEWDVSLWDATGTSTVTTKWQSVGKSGFIISPQVQITCGITPFPRIELIASDVIYETGGVMV